MALEAPVPGVIRQGLKIGSVEEVAYRMGYIDGAQMERLATALRGNPYAQYLLDIVRDDQR